jgi:hypothetical protein
MAPSRGSPLWAMAETNSGDTDARPQHFDPHAKPAPDCDFDERIAW